MTGENAIGMLHYLIYSVHMPLFILISGFLGKRKQSLKSVVYKQIVPYVCFDFLYALCMAALGDASGLNILIPTYVYWYILCIAIMRLMTSYIKRKHLIIVALLCIMVSCIMAMLKLNESYWRFLSLGRVFLLFPIYLTGYFLSNKMVDWFSKRKIFALMVPLVIAIEILLLHNGCVGINWATHDQPLSLDENMMKLIYMVLSVALFIGLVSITTKRKCFLTQWGRNSILVYLVHPFVILIAQKIIQLFDISNDYGLLLIYILLAVLITQVLSLNVLNKIYNEFIKSVAMHLKLTEG